MTVDQKQRIDRWLGAWLLVVLRPLAQLAGALLRRDHRSNPRGGLCWSAQRLPVCNSKHPPREPVDAVVFVTFAGVGPVDDIDGAVGAVVEVDAAEPGVGGLGDVGGVVADVAAAVAFEPIDVDAAAMEIEREQLAAIFGGPIVAQINAGPAVGVAAAELIVDGVVTFGAVGS